MGKITFFISLLLFPLLSSAEIAHEQLVLQLRWVTQTQFAGYYVALDKGFYEKQGLDVTILSGGPNLSSSENLRSGAIDLSIEWMADALILQQEGERLINVAQIFHNAGYALSCRKDRGIEQLSDLDGKRIGSWFVGDELKIESILKKLKLSAELYPQNFNVNDLIEGRADCIATMRYNEYWQLLAGGMDPSELSIFDFKEAELSTLEDGLYILESNLKDPQMRNRIVRFIAATIEGWRYTLDHPQEALEVVLDNDPTGVLDEEHQRRMLQIITTLLHPNRDKIGLLDEQRYQQTVNLLRQSNILKSAPLGFYTTELWSEAIELLR